jgi:hypothetical protein
MNCKAVTTDDNFASYKKEVNFWTDGDLADNFLQLEREYLQ